MLAVRRLSREKRSEMSRARVPTESMAIVLFAVYRFVMLVEPRDASAVAYDGEHACRHHRHHDEFSHAANAAANGLEPREWRVCANGEANDACKHDAEHEDYYDVEAQKGCDEYGEVWYYEEEGVDALRRGFQSGRGQGFCGIIAKECEYGEGKERRW